MSNHFAREQLIKMAHYRMPFGKYKGRYLVQLPLPYLLWFRQKGFPGGRLGHFLQTMLEIRENGLEALIYRIQKDFPEEAS